jgi:hypothetical protein
MSLVFLWAPDVPANVPLLKGLSIAAMLAIVPIGWCYFQQRGLSSPTAAGLTLAVVATPAFVFLATSTLILECVFTLALLAGTFMADRSVNGSHPRRAAVAAGAIAAGAVLIRSAGLPLPIGIGLLLVWRRRWPQALLFAATCSLCLAPWRWYAATHSAPRELQAAHGGSQAWSYGEQFWMRRAGDPSGGTVAVRDLPARVRDGLVDVFGRDIGGIMLPTLYRGANESGQEVVAVGGGIPVRDGLVMPAGMGSATGTMIVSSLLSIVTSTAPQEWVTDSQDADALLDWMRTHLTEQGYVASDNPALVYLRAGRKGIAIDDAARKWPRWKSMGVRYLVNLQPSKLPPDYGPHQVLYRSPNGTRWVVQI